MLTAASGVDKNMFPLIAGAGAMYSPTGASAAQDTAGAGAMSSTKGTIAAGTGAAHTACAQAEAQCTQRHVQVLRTLDGAGAMCSSTGAGATRCTPPLALVFRTRLVLAPPTWPSLCATSLLHATAAKKL